nr:hypothetical protein Hi04_10k_c1122_00006 [uncultured bacterium]
MTDTTFSFLPAELTELGLLAAVDPYFAERLLEALRRLPVVPPSETPVHCETPGEPLREGCV